MVEFKGSTDSIIYTHIMLSEEGFDNLVTFNPLIRLLGFSQGPWNDSTTR